MEAKEEKAYRKVAEGLLPFKAKKLERHQLIVKIAERITTPLLERIPYYDQDFCRWYGTSLPTYRKIEKELKEQRDKTPDGQSIGDFMTRMYALAMEGKNARYAELWAKISGVLKEKAEVDVNLRVNPDEFNRRMLEASRELRDEGYAGAGVVKVSAEPAILPGALCIGSGQGSPENSEVADVAASKAGSGHSAGVDRPAFSS